MKKNRIPWHPLLVFCLLPLLAVAGEQPATDVSKTDMAGIYNYSRSAGGTGFGGATEPSAMQALGDAGYGAVINLRLAGEKGVDIEASREAASAAGLTYIHLPLDTSDPDPAFFDEFLAAVGDEANQPVYIHCGSATRVAAMWMSKRVLQDGWTAEAAEAEARAIAGKPDAAVSYAEKFIEERRQE